MPYDNFKALIRKGMGKLTQKELAEKTGISAEHLSRMLSEDYIYKPSKQSIRKLSTAMTGVSIGELYKAAGYLKEAVLYGSKDPENENEKRLTMSFASRESAAIEDLKIASKNLKGRIFDSIKELTKEINTLYAAEDLQYTFGEKELAKSKDADYVTGLIAEFETEAIRTKIYFAVYYYITLKGKIIFDSLGFSGQEVIETGILPDFILEEYKKYKIDPETLPQIIITKKSTSEELLLEAIFGKGSKNEIEMCFTGMGFYLTAIPEHFKEFKEKHGEPLEDYNYGFLETNSEEFKAAEYIASILRKETGLEFLSYNKTDKNPVCVISAEDIDHSLAVKTLLPYAKELGVKELNHCYVFALIERDDNPIPVED